MEDLGAGFNLAMHDLEIRGAGELLGEEQSGHMHEIGFSLYMEMLEEAVRSLKEGKKPGLEKPAQHGPEIDLHVSALIPDKYVPDVNERLILYKRLSSSKNNNDIENLKSELIDRFGLLPEAAQNLFRIAEIKLQASTLGIKKIDLGKDFGYIQFEEKPIINTSALIDLIQKQSDKYQLQGGSRLRFKLTETELGAKIIKLSQILKSLRIS